MSEPAALEGDYADFRLVRTRGVAQITVEIPLEMATEAVRLFGVPLPGKPARMAVARLAEPVQIEAQPAANNNGSRSWRDLTPAQQAGIRCNEQAFQRFLREEGASSVKDEAGAAAYVRLICGVHSRAHLVGRAAEKWQALEDRFQAWMHPA